MHLKCFCAFFPSFIEYCAAATFFFSRQQLRLLRRRRWLLRHRVLQLHILSGDGGARGGAAVFRILGCIWLIAIPRGASNC